MRHPGAVADLLVVTGPPGAGKSTVSALVVAAFETAALVPGDVFFGFRVRGAVAPWLPEAHDQNEVTTRAAAAAAGAFAAGGCPVVYDGMVGPWFLPVFAGELARQGVRVAEELHHVVLLPDLARCQRQVAERTGHGFTDAAATARMHAEFAAAEIEERRVITDLSGGPDAVARRVLVRYAAGDLLVRPHGRPGPAR